MGYFDQPNYDLEFIKNSPPQQHHRRLDSIPFLIARLPERLEYHLRHVLHLVNRLRENEKRSTTINSTKNLKLNAHRMNMLCFENIYNLKEKIKIQTEKNNDNFVALSLHSRGHDYHYFSS